MHCLLYQTLRESGYSDKKDAEETYACLRDDLPTIARSNDGQKVMKKFVVLAKTATNEATFNDMIKIIWRLVKPMTSSPLHRLSLFFLAVGAMCETLLSGPTGSSVSSWMDKFEKWLGEQLTIGGKGVTGDGEGSVTDRIQRFFSTPYLHDYD